MENVEFYYLRDKGNDVNTVKGHPFGVVAVSKNLDGTVNRGISLCATVDEFDKDVGRKIAYNRLIKVEKDTKNIGGFAPYFGKNMLRPDIGDLYRGEYHQTMNAVEKSMFRVKKNQD